MPKSPKPFPSPADLEPAASPPGDQDAAVESGLGRRSEDAFGAPPGPDSATVDLTLGRARFRANVTHTPGGLVALGACVATILAGASLIVWAASAPVRRHPVASALTLRR